MINVINGTYFNIYLSKTINKYCHLTINSLYKPISMTFLLCMIQSILIHLLNFISFTYQITISHINKCYNSNSINLIYHLNHYTSNRPKDYSRYLSNIQYSHLKYQNYILLKYSKIIFCLYQFLISKSLSLTNLMSLFNSYL